MLLKKQSAGNIQFDTRQNQKIEATFKSYLVSFCVCGQNKPILRLLSALRLKFYTFSELKIFKQLLKICVFLTFCEVVQRSNMPKAKFMLHFLNLKKPTSHETARNSFKKLLCQHKKTQNFPFIFSKFCRKYCQHVQFKKFAKLAKGTSIFQHPKNGPFFGQKKSKKVDFCQFYMVKPGSDKKSDFLSTPRVRLYLIL